ncbi:MAG: hypothetical protein K2X81_01660 [Candidatus Obscuribacterales bacterium]|nr:hypothetical protein [Candidatus Obscuribacterales bacterium]
MSFRDHSNKILKFFIKLACAIFGTLIGAIFGSLVMSVFFPGIMLPVAALAYGAFFAAMGCADFITGKPTLDEVDICEDMRSLPENLAKLATVYKREIAYAWFGGLFAGSFAGGIGLLVFMATCDVYIFAGILLFGTSVGIVSSLTNLWSRRKLLG